MAMVMIPFAAASKYEVDLMFPRNETYAPQALMPVVFALQNPALIASIGSYSISWSLTRDDNSSVPGSINGAVFEGNLAAQSSQVEPYYDTASVNTMAYPDSSWTLSWFVNSLNCTPLLAGYDPYHREYNGSVTFATKKGAQLPDLVAATAPGACDSATGIAFDVLSVTKGRCASLGPYVSGSANPCGASLNATGASSITAEATAFACSVKEKPLHPNVTCPKSTDSSSADRSKASAYAWSLLFAVAAASNAFC